jgi:hypothetical protein
MTSSTAFSNYNMYFTINKLYKSSSTEPNKAEKQCTETDTPKEKIKETSFMFDTSELDI